MRWPWFLGLRLFKAVGYFKHQTPKHPHHQQPSVALGVSWPKAASQAWCVASRCRRHDPLATAPPTKRWDWIKKNCFQHAEKSWIKNTHTKQSKIASQRMKVGLWLIITFITPTKHLKQTMFPAIRGSWDHSGSPVDPSLSFLATSEPRINSLTTDLLDLLGLGSCVFFPRIHWQSPVMRSNSMSQLGSSNKISCCPAGQVVGSNPHGCPVGGTHRMALSMANNFRQTRVV